MSTPHRILLIGVRVSGGPKVKATIAHLSSGALKPKLKAMALTAKCLLLPCLCSSKLFAGVKKAFRVLLENVVAPSRPHHQSLGTQRGLPNKISLLKVPPEPPLEAPSEGL